MENTFIWPSPIAHIVRTVPDTAQIYFCPKTLQSTAKRFLDGFDGLVTYAVKANAGEEVLSNLISAGINAFDVASPNEIKLLRSLSGHSTLHYNNPVRSEREISYAISMGVRSFSVDCVGELDKLAGVPAGSEISVRLALPVSGAAYDFGSKFGADADLAVSLLRKVAALGFSPSITFHPGTQCRDVAAWGHYIGTSAEIARCAGQPLKRLNVGGGFPADRNGDTPNLEEIFSHISREARRHFGESAPELVCEPGRAMVAEAFTLATRVKAVRTDGTVFLNDGLYGGLAETRDLPLGSRYQVYSPIGEPRKGESSSRVVFGPTCDSIDRLPDTLSLPEDLSEGDFILFDGMGAYSRSLATRFNGYGLADTKTVSSL